MPRGRKKCGNDTEKCSNDTEKRGNDTEKYGIDTEFINKSFGLNNQDIVEMEKFIADHKRKSAKEFFDEVFNEPSFGTREKMAVSYIVGRFMREAIDMRVEVLKESIVDAVENYQKK